MYFIKYIVRVLLVIAAVALLTIMCITVANICGRSLFRFCILGAIEIAGLCGAVVVSFSLFYTQLEHRNVVTSIVFDMLPKPLQRTIEKFNLVLSSGIVGLMAYCAAMGAQEAAAEGDVTAILAIHIWPFKIIWVAGCVALCAVLFGQLFKAVIGVKKK